MFIWTVITTCINFISSATVPINLILQDGSVLQLNAVTDGDVDLTTLQNLGETYFQAIDEYKYNLYLYLYKEG